MHDQVTVRHPDGGAIRAAVVATPAIVPATGASAGGRPAGNVDVDRPTAPDPSASPAPRLREPQEGQDRPDRRADERRQAGWRLHLGLAAVAYLPLLLTRPGWVSADTKTYLYLDPGQLLARSRSMWDPTVGMGTVSHQRIGFLWPMGPYYWLCEAVGLPDWIAQRLWWGTIVLAAGAGVAYLLRVLGWRPGPGVTAAVFTYALSPVILTLVARLSGVLLPFCALPWLVAFTVQTVRHRGWRHPALFALCAVTFGSVNATGLLLVGLAPVLWLLYAVVGAREASVVRALRAGARIGVLTLAVSAWWIAGLNVQRTHGLEIIRYSETARTVASASVSHEVLRGLGYWFFYGRDRLGPWIEPSRGYTQWAPLLAVTYLVPMLGIAGAAVARWRYRAFFVLLVLLGTALAVGAHPWDTGPPFPALVRRFQSTEAGLAMRSLPRAVPLVALGIAVLLGAGVTAVVRRWPRGRRPITVAVVALAVLALPPLWLGQFVPDNLRRREEIPRYWQNAAVYLDAHDDGTRVLVVPGSDFAAYGWGATVDPILPGLMDRPSVQREAVPNGSPASAHLLDALDLTLQEGTADPDALAPMARLLRAGDVAVVGDWAYERNSVPEPGRFWDFASGAPGFAEPEPFGVATRSEEDGDGDVEGAVEAEGGSEGDVPAVGVLPLPEQARLPIVSTHPAERPLLVAGDGAGLVDAAGVGLIDGSELVRYAATLDGDDVRAALDDGAVLLLTDSNRKRGERWNTLRHNRGATETAGGGPLATDPNDNRLPVFPGQGTDSMTVVERHGGIGAEATSYGNAITYVPEERPMMAVDGDPDTAWRTAAFEDARGERLELTTARPVTTDRITFHQHDEDVSRHVTRVRLRFSSAGTGTDDRGELDIELPEAGRDGAGQTVTFPERTFSRVSIEILEDSAGTLPRWSAQSSVGFSEVELGGEPNPADPEQEVVRLPTDLLDAAGPTAVDHPLAVTLTRQRQDRADPSRADEERALVRAFALPGPRSFSLAGTARLSPWADPAVTGALIGWTRDGASAWADSSDRPTGAVVSSAAQGFDGDPATAWTTDGPYLEGQWLEVGTPRPVTIDALPVTVVADAAHSPPTEITLSVDGEEVATVDVPELDGTSTVELDVPRVRGSRFRLELSEVDEQGAPDGEDGDPPLPVAIAEVGLPGPTVPGLHGRLDTGCRDDLLTAGGRAVPLRVRGTMADALAGRPLEVTPCGDRTDLTLRTENLVRSTSGRTSGIDIDQLVLRSAGGGAASTSDAPLVAESPTAPSDPPRVEVVDESAAGLRLRVSGATPGTPFWLALGQSYNDGWAATVEGDDQVIRPELVDGFANGWRIEPRSGSFDIELEFTPQRSVDVALWISLLAGLLCLALARRPARPMTDPSDPPTEPGAFSARVAFRYAGRRPGTAATAGVALGMGALAWVLAGPAVGVIAGTVAAVGCRYPRARAVVLAGSAGALALAAAYVVVIQVLHHPEPGLDWPHEMRRAHPLGWTAVLLLTADLVVAHAWRRPHRPDT